MPFDIRTATVDELIERADYLVDFSTRCGGSERYRGELISEARALRQIAATRVGRAA